MNSKHIPFFTDIIYEQQTSSKSVSKQVAVAIELSKSEKKKKKMEPEVGCDDVAVAIKGLLPVANRGGEGVGRQEGEEVDVIVDAREAMQ